MRHTVAAVLTAATLLTLTGCSSSDSPKPATAPSTSAAAPAPSTSTTLSAADQIKACTDALAAGQDSSAPECADLSPDDYMQALQDANKQGQGKLQDLIDQASQSAQP